jgi:hypothetical protein
MMLHVRGKSNIAPDKKHRLDAKTWDFDPKRTLLMKTWLGYGMIAGSVVAFVALWTITRDVTGALLSLICLALAAALLIAVAAYPIVNAPHWLRRLRGITWSDHVKRLEEIGNAERQQYQTHRAVVVDDLATGRLVHLIDVGDDKILCLYGQEYYEYEPIDDDPDMNQPRRFPTRTFSLLRHKKKGEVLALFPGSDVVDPLVCEPSASEALLQTLGDKLKDGKLSSHVPFEVLAELAVRTPVEQQ